MRVLLLAILALSACSSVIHAATVAEMEAMVKAHPDDHRAWAGYAIALIDAGKKQVGDDQTNSYRLALQSAQKSQELYNNQHADGTDALTAVLVAAASPKGQRTEAAGDALRYRGDKISLSALGITLAYNDQKPEAIKTLTRAIQVYEANPNLTPAQMQQKSNLQEFLDHLGMPTVTWRQATIGFTQVAKITNTQDTPLVINLIHMRDGASQKVASLALNPHEMKEIGHMEGFKFKIGDTLTIQMVGTTKNRDMTVVVP